MRLGRRRERLRRRSSRGRACHRTLACHPHLAYRLASCLLTRNAPPANPAMLLAHAAIDVMVLDWPSELSAVLVMRRDGPVIGLNRRHRPERRHFSFWHEVGHYLIHRPRLSNGLLACPDPAIPRMADLKLEREADVFAANVMVPADWVRRSYRGQSTLRGLAREFGVTPTAMTRRMRELDPRLQRREAVTTRLRHHGTIALAPLVQAAASLARRV